MRQNQSKWVALCAVVLTLWVGACREISKEDQPIFDAYRARDWLKAEALLTKRIAERPNKPGPRFILGLVYLELGNWPKSEEALLSVTKDRDLRSVAGYALTLVEIRKKDPTGDWIEQAAQAHHRYGTDIESEFAESFSKEVTNGWLGPIGTSESKRMDAWRAQVETWIQELRQRSTENAMLAACLLTQARESADPVGCLKDVVARFPESLQVRAAYASVLWSSDKPESKPPLKVQLEWLAAKQPNDLVVRLARAYPENARACVQIECGEKPEEGLESCLAVVPEVSKLISEGRYKSLSIETPQPNSGARAFDEIKNSLPPYSTDSVMVALLGLGAIQDNLAEQTAWRAIRYVST